VHYFINATSLSNKLGAAKHMQRIEIALPFQPPAASVPGEKRKLKKIQQFARAGSQAKTCDALPFPCSIAVSAVLGRAYTRQRRLSTTRAELIPA
jgi:hypothetical protein